MQKNKKLIIAGMGETALLAYEFFSCDSGYEPICFAVDAEFMPPKREICGLPIETLKDIEDKYDPSDYDAFVAVSSKQLNYSRTALYNVMKKKGYNLASYVSSDAYIWRNAEIGDNCFVLAHTIMQPFTSIGNNTFLWVKTNIGHRAVVEDNVFIATADIAGFSHIGHNTFLGVNAVVADEVSIGCDNFISMGCCISKNTQQNSLYAGNPAKKQPISAKEYFGINE